MSRIRLVCFDLGGVVIRICRSWEEGCRAAGIAVRGPSHNDPSGANGQHDLSRRYQSGAIDDATYFQELSRASQGRYAPADFQRVHDSWLLGEYPGIASVIDQLNRSNLRTAALSNTNASHWRALQRFGAFNALSIRLASHEMRLLKPHPEMYDAARERFGVEASEILFFDDLTENIEAARSLGWNAVHIDHAGDTAAQVAHSLRDHGIQLDAHA